MEWKQKGVPQEYSRRAYRYATPFAINISGEGGPAVGRVERHSGESPEPGIYNETKKGLSPSFFPTSSSSRLVLLVLSVLSSRLPFAIVYSQARAA